MSITCKICNTEFKKIIPWQHLKLHGVTSDEYKSKYGSLYSKETLEKLAAKIPHNKGTNMSSDQKQKLRDKALERNKLWRDTNSNPIVGTKRSAETRKKIKEKRQQQVILSESAKKAYQTRKKNGNALTFLGHVHTPETKKIIGIKSKQSNLKKSQLANNQIIEKISSISLTLLSNITEPTLLLQCTICNNIFSFTKQYFHLAKFKASMCPTCFPRVIKRSAGEQELFDFVLSICPDAISNYRETYHNKEIDVFVPSLNIGFEFNGIYWHSETVLINNNKNPKSDYEKQKYFAENNIQLIQIFEDEWQNKKNIVQSRIRNILQGTSSKIYARHCVVKEISSKESSIFLNKNHLMGNGRSNKRYGLFYNNKLVSVMTFTKSNISRKLNAEWELNRFASIVGSNVVGGASKLFSWFIKTENPTNVVSYSDNRWSTGKLYSLLGFTKVSNGTPSYWYTLPNSFIRIHRYALKKNKNDNQLLSEWENRLQQGYNRVWDSGHSKWQWSK